MLHEPWCTPIRFCNNVRDVFSNISSAVIWCEMTFNHMKCTEARAQTLASRLYLLSASPGYRDTSAFGAVATLSTSSTIIHLLHGPPFAIPSDTLSCSCVQYEPISFISTSSPTKTRWLWHIQVQFLDRGGSLAHLLLHRNRLFCWHKFSLSSWAEGHVVQLQLQALVFSWTLWRWAPHSDTAFLLGTFLTGQNVLAYKDVFKIYIHWRCHESELLRGQDRIALSSRTGSISPWRKLAGAASGMPGNHGHSFVTTVSFFSIILRSGERQVVTNLAVRHGTDLLLATFSFVSVVCGSNYTIRSGPLL